MDAFANLAASPDAFDVWFKEWVKETTGTDLNSPPPGPMSEMLSDFHG